MKGRRPSLPPAPQAAQLTAGTVPRGHGEQRSEPSPPDVGALPETLLSPASFLMEGRAAGVIRAGKTEGVFGT